MQAGDKQEGKWFICKSDRGTNAELYGPFEDKQSAQQALQRYMSCPLKRAYDDEWCFTVVGLPATPWYGDDIIISAKTWMQV